MKRAATRVISRTSPCCEAKGETLDEAVENANEAALRLYWINLLELSEDEVNLPPVSEVSDLELKEGDIVRNIQVTIKFMEGSGRIKKWRIRDLI